MDSELKWTAAVCFAQFLYSTLTFLKSFPFTHLCCSCCLPPSRGSRAGLPGWQRCACAGSWWSAGWLRPCPAGWWWPRAEAASWPARRTRNSPSPAANEPHCGTSLYAGSGDWEVSEGEGVRQGGNKVWKSRDGSKMEKKEGQRKQTGSTRCRMGETGEGLHITTTHWPPVDWFVLHIDDLSINLENSFHKHICW